MSEILKVKSLSKVYGSKTTALTVLKDINFSVLKGESAAIIGPSGSGKTTLLGLCAGLDRVTDWRNYLEPYPHSMSLMKMNWPKYAIRTLVSFFKIFN